MTPADKQAIARLTDDLDGAAGDTVSVHAADLRTLLALVREPVASVTGSVRYVYDDSGGRDVPRVRLHLDECPPAWAGAVEGQPLRIDVHAVDAGEEK